MTIIRAYADEPLKKEEIRSFFAEYKGPEMIQPDEAIHGYMTMPDLEKGKLFFIAMEDDRILATLGVVLAALEWKDEAYLTGSAVMENMQSIEAFRQLIVHVESLGMRSKPHLKFRLGIGPRLEFLMPYAQEWGYVLTDRMCHLEKHLSGSQASANGIRMVATDRTTATEYVQIHDICFDKVPNSARASLEDVLESIEVSHGKGMNEGPWLGFFVDGRDKAIGFYELSLKDGAGWIEAIGILPEFRGSGLGQIILDLCGEHFKAHGFDRMGLLVMDSNKRAHSLYLNYGFESIAIYNNWFQKEV